MNQRFTFFFQNQLDDDDFGDFGGFEAAEPVVDNAASEEPSGVEASPSPWAILGLGSDSVGARPDLLCGQNRFPPLLDPSVPAPEDGATAGPTENDVSAPRTNALDVPGALPQAQGFDEASYVNDILDGSFRSNSSPHSAGPALSAQPEHISNTLDLVPSSSRGASANGNVREPDLTTGPPDIAREPANEVSEKPDVANDSAVGGIVVEEVDSMEQMASNNNAVKNVIMATGPQSSFFGPVSSGPPSSGEKSSGGGDNSIPSGADTSVLTCPVYIPKNKAFAQSEGISNQAYNEISAVREDSKAAVQAVVDQYKTLMATTLSQQQEMFQCHLQESRDKEGEQLKLQLQQQSAILEEMFKEEKKKLQEELLNLAKEQMQAQEKEFQTFLEEEKKKSQQMIEESSQREREASQDQLERAIKEEKERTEEALKEQQEKFDKLLTEEKEKSTSEMQEMLQDERRKFKVELASAVEEERTKHQDYMQKALELAKKEAESYVQQQREVSICNNQSYAQQQRELDHVVRQRQFSSLDIFLGSARDQLSLLMNKDSDKSSTSDQDIDKPS
ncbi:hypothetical protein FSP39_011422 [Pinctada imbricata]|uniref:Uncharacterized protein n=1 Tax=Pinctada imbricata TaxID=66713 RepID=A0AA88YIT5_PINIB|nr:hypothetical protein FSP39_011422 [Pinctada imbricata]